MGVGALVLPSVRQEAVEVRLGTEQPSCMPQILDQVMVSYPGGKSVSEFVREIRKYAARIGAYGIKDIVPVDTTKATANVVTSGGLVTVSASVAESVTATLYSCSGNLTPIQQGMWHCAQGEYSTVPHCMMDRESCERLYLSEYGAKSTCREAESVYCIIKKENGLQKQTCFQAESWCREALAKTAPTDKLISDFVSQCRQWNSVLK